jgi:hypothetical protein
MEQKKPEYLMPALVAGGVSGVLSGIPFVNCLCCLWIIGGAAWAAHILAGRTPGGLTGGDGAIVGALTGIVAAIAGTVIEIPFRSFNAEQARRLLEMLPDTADEMPAGLGSWLSGGSWTSPGFFLLGLFVSAVVFTGLGVLGGVIGVSLFGRKRVPPPPPWPETGPPHAV